MDEEGKLYSPSVGGALRQGEVLSDLIQARVVPGRAIGDTHVDLVTHPFAVVLSQDCDLDLDFLASNEPEAVKNPSEKKLPNVLFCEAVTATEMRGRLADGQVWRQITQNKNERYQYLRGATPETDALALGFPDLGLDFKRYFTVPTPEVYSQLQGSAKRRSRLHSPYVEHLCSRFAFYLARVALPEEHLARKL